LAENIIQVNEQDEIVGPIDRLLAHKDDGILHRGLMVVVKNSRKEILLTQRSETRPDLDFPAPFPGFWDITMAGHPKWGQKDYVTQMAVELKEELGISVSSNEINYIGKFQYHVPDPTYPNKSSPQGFRLSEFEICGVGVLETDQKPRLNEIELQNSLWLSGEELSPKLQEVKHLKMAPWALIMLEKFQTIAR
jgi:isopentenyl-diphosphate delta-isomerase type 1